MKKLLFIAFLSFGVLSLQAQTKDTTALHHKNKKVKNKMAQQLSLTESQKEELKKFKEQNKAQKEAITSNKLLTEQQKQDQLKELKASQRQETAKILTTEQKAKLADLNKKKKHKKG